MVGARSLAMDTKEVARAFTDAVVVITSDDGSGTGFVVGSKGYVLTCAHVIPMLGDPEVSFRRVEGGNVAMKSVKATVLRMDQKRDLALLKIDAGQALPVVRLETAGKLEMGEPVSVIGNPGLGRKILDYTMTQGIVSNPVRKIEGQDFVQTSAAVNPGASGGPMFNSKGNVVGLAVLKASIENTGFAVPAEHMIAFLKSCSADAPSGGQNLPVAGGNPDRQCASWMAMADSFIKNGVPDKAREYLQKIIDTYPSSDQANTARAKLKALGE
jgi:serine protease Do